MPARKIELSTSITALLLSFCRLTIGRWIPFTAAIILLSGCVAVPTTTITRNAEQFRAEPRGEGLVVVSLVVNTSEVSQVSGLRLQRLDAPIKPGKKQPQLPPEYILSNAISGKSRDLSLVVGSLPAGRYKIIEINFWSKYIDLRTNSPLSEIVVTAGEATDLGMVVVTAANMKILIGRSRPYQDSKFLINRYFAKDETLQNARTGGWVSPIQNHEIAEFFAITHPQGIGNISENAQGEVIAGTRLGTVIARDGKGQWQVIARTGTYDPITLVSASTKGSKDSVMAFTDIGEAYSIENKKATKIPTGNLPSGRVFFIHSNPQETRWFAGVMHDEKSELLTATSLDGNWQPVYSDTVKFSTWSGARNAWAAKLPNGVVYASSVSPEIRCFDFTTEKWTSVNVPNKRTVLDIKVNSVTGMIGLLTGPGGGLGGAFASPVYAEQCGKAWEKIDSPYSVQVAAPIGMNDGSIAVLGGVFGDAGIYASTDKGKTWTKRTNQSVLVDNFYQTENNGLFIVSNGRDGLETVSHSADNGATWDRELSSFDHQLFNSNTDKK